MTGTDMHFTPLMNGIDYLESVVEHLSGEPTHRDLKFAVLHLQAAAEVLLKRRLQTEHWTLVVKDTGKATRDRFDAGDFQSVTVEETVRRLTEIVGVPVAADEAKALRRLAWMRNQLQHWGLRASTAEVEQVAVRVLDFLIGFIEAHLPNELEQDSVNARASMALVSERLDDIEQYVAQRLQRISSEIEGEGRAGATVQCPACDNMTLVVAGPSGTCRYCSSTYESTELVDAYLGSVLGFSWRVRADGGESPLHECPMCEAETLVSDVWTAASVAIPAPFCFTCATSVHGTAGCARCGTVFLPSGDETVCDNCFAIAMSKD